MYASNKRHEVVVTNHSACPAAHTSKRAREEPDSEAEDMAVEPGFSAAGFSGHNSAGAVQQLATTAGAAAAARKQARQQAADAAASAGNGAADVPEAEEAAGEDGLPPPQQGDCIVFVSLSLCHHLRI